MFQIKYIDDKSFSFEISGYEGFSINTITSITATYLSGLARASTLGTNIYKEGDRVKFLNSNNANYNNKQFIIEDSDSNANFFKGSAASPSNLFASMLKSVFSPSLNFL